MDEDEQRAFDELERRVDLLEDQVTALMLGDDPWSV